MFSKDQWWFKKVYEDWKGLLREYTWMAGGSWDFSWSCVNNHTILKHMFIGEGGIMEFMMTELPVHPTSLHDTITLKGPMCGRNRRWGCQRCNRTPLVLNTLQWCLLWCGVMPGLRGDQRCPLEDVGEDRMRRSGQSWGLAHSPWLAQTLPSVAYWDCSAVGLYFLFLNELFWVSCIYYEEK